MFSRVFFSLCIRPYCFTAAVNTCASDSLPTCYATADKCHLLNALAPYTSGEPKIVTQEKPPGCLTRSAVIANRDPFIETITDKSHAVAGKPREAV